MRSKWMWMAAATFLALLPVEAGAQATGDIVLRFGTAHDPTGDLDPFDPFFYTDRADFYCKGRVGAGPLMMSAPPVSNRDEVDLGFTVTQTVPRTTRFHAVHLELWDSDDLSPSGDLHVDLSPATGRKSLDLTFDACVFAWNGDVTGRRRGGPVRGAGDGDIGELTFDIDTGDGRPFSPDDVAIHEAYPVQSTLDDDYVSVGKATAIRVGLTSSYSGPRVGTVTVTARDGVGTVFTETRAVTVPPEGTTLYMFDGSFVAGPPIIPAGTPNLSQFCWDVSIDFGAEGPAGGPPPAFVNCYTQNNNVVNSCRRFAFIDNPTVVYMPYDWTAGGGPNPPAAADVAATFESAEPFRLATSPIPFLDGRMAPSPLVDTSVADFGEPFVSMVEFAPMAMAAGIDRLVLMPRQGWFADNASEMPFVPSGVIGISMAEIVPRVVIAEAGYSETPTHEIGHTYRLSRRPCTTGGIFETLFELGCRDEYKHTSPPAPYPASGFDVRGEVYPLGKNPVAINTREVNTTNIMGSTGALVGEHRLWIDRLSYNHLTREMHLPGGPLPPLLVSAEESMATPTGEGPPEVATAMAPAPFAITTAGWVQAMNGITSDPPIFAALMLPSYLVDSAVSGFDLPEIPLGGTSGSGPFAVRFLTPQGTRTFRFLPAVRPAEVDAPIDGGPYALALPWDPTTTRIELFGPTDLYDPANNQDTLLAFMNRSAAAPFLQKVRAGLDFPPTQGGPQPEPPTIPPGHTVGLSWEESDADSAELQRQILLVAPQQAGGGLFPLAAEAPAGQWVMPPAVRDALPPGNYGLRFLISDGINSSTVEVAQAFSLCAFTNNGVEACDGIDNDCNGVIDDAAPPAGSALVVVTDTKVSWDAMPAAQSYDVVRGDLGVLRSTGGDFKSAILGCLANDTATTSATFSETPAVGGGFFVLVRPVGCGGAGTYDSNSPGQVGLRDSEIANAADACP